MFSIDIDDKRHLLIVPSGVLTGPPFLLLVAEPLMAPEPNDQASATETSAIHSQPFSRSPALPHERAPACRRYFHRQKLVTRWSRAAPSWVGAAS